MQPDLNLNSPFQKGPDCFRAFFCVLGSLYQLAVGNAELQFGTPTATLRLLRLNG